MRRITVRGFKALPLGSPDEAAEPLQVTSHGFPVGMWFPTGTEPRDTSEGYARATVRPTEAFRREFRPVPKASKR